MPTTDSMLTVPLQVDAMLVGDEHASNLPKWATPTSQPPFTDATPPARGVYVHWKIPDGLTRELADRENGSSPHSFPAIPDLWLVIRLGPPHESTGRRTSVRAWVVDSVAAARGEAPVVLDPAGTWTAPPSSGRPRMTAAGFFDAQGRSLELNGQVAREARKIQPAFTAYRPDSGGSFTLYDDLSALAAPLTYVVVGWYANPAFDPLSGDLDSRRSFLERAKWSLPFDAPTRELPAKTLCHGMVVGVGLGGPYNLGGGKPESLNERKRMAAALGSSSVEAYARLENPDAPDLGALLGVFLTRAQGLFAETGGLAEATAMLHAMGFLAKQGDQRTTRSLVHDDPVAQLRRLGFERSLEWLDTLAAPPAFVEWLRGAAREIGGLPRGGERELLADLLLCVLGQLALLAGVSRADLARDVGSIRGRAAPGLRASGGTLSQLVARLPKVSGLAPSALAAALSSLERELAGGTRQRLAVRRREVSSAADPWWLPAPVSLVVLGAGATIRHGHDGRFEIDGTLACRTTAFPTFGAGLRVEGSGAALVHPSFVTRRVYDVSKLPAAFPRAVGDVVAETLMFDPHNARAFARECREVTGQSWSESQVAQVEQDLEAEAQYLWWRGDPSSDPAEVRAQSAYAGTLPSPLAVNPWREPWAPVFLEYELSCAPYPPEGDFPKGWTLGDFDYEYSPPRTPQPLSATTIRGRTVVTQTPRKLLGSAFADLERSEGEAAGDDLARAAANAHFLDVLATSLSAVAMRAGSGSAPTLKSLAGAQGPIFAARVEVTQYRVLDAFGQVLAVGPRSASAHGLPDRFDLPPRLTIPARVHLRYLSAANPAVESDQGEDVACALLRVDRLDRALEFYNVEGDAVGQLVGEGGRVRWDPAPGQNAHVGRRPDASDFRGGGDAAVKMISALIDSTATAAASGVTPLDVLIRALDATLHAVQREPPSGELLSTLTSRPIALVRARLALRTKGGVAPPIPARLGSLMEPGDGLLGYFLRDDYTQFYPLHTDALKEAAGASGARPPYVSAPTSGYNFVTIPSGEDGVVVTMLLAVGGTVHVTTGLLPRIERQPAWASLATSLAKLVPTFRVGPVLVDPTTPSLPLPNVPGQPWSWVHRNAPPGASPTWSVETPRPLEDRLTTLNVQFGWVAPARAK